MKNKKRIIKTLLLITLIIAMIASCLCGCNEETDKPTPTEKPTAIPTPIPTVHPDVQIGDYVSFGSYEQDNNMSNGKEAIEWLVLDVEDGNALLISKYALDCQQYNTSWSFVTWETCTLRTWLNDTFYNSAFSSGEQSQIKTSYVSVEDNEYYGTEAGNSTNDKVFLLSISEAKKYFSWGPVRVCAPTAYAKAQGARSLIAHENYWWWLRSPGVGQSFASNVDREGAVFEFGYRVDDDFGVRPALWVNLDSSSVTSNPTGTSTLMPTVNLDVQIGDYVTFGSYEQDNDMSNGKEEIEWLVLDVEDGKALLISKYALACQPYNTELKNVTWETCTLRTWLNGDFYNTAFSNEEKACIATSYVYAENNEYFETEAGNSTNDKIFLLSISEVEKYFNSDAASTCKPTAYAEVQGAYANSSTGNCWWWLRSPGLYQYSASIVGDIDDVRDGGSDVDYINIGVRPALWVNLDS